MGRRPSVLEVGAVHVVSWWCVRIVTSQLAVLHSWEPSSAAWWLARLLRAALVVGIVLGWARVRGITSPTIGLGGVRFWRNGCIGLAVTSILWLGVALVRGKGILGTHPAVFPEREVAILTTGMDVVAQQLPTFGLLQGVLGSSWLVFATTWLSFTAAHLVGAPLSVVLTAGAVGLVFALLRRYTGNLGAGLGVHFAYYGLLILLAWGVGAR